PHEHVAENKLAISRNAHAHERFIADSVTERIFRTHVNVPQRANNSAVDWDVPVRALQYATGRIGDVAAFAYWRMNAELELLGHRDLDLRVFARGSENTHAFDATFRSDDRELLFASILTGLRKIRVFGELMSLAEQRLNVILGEVNVVGRDLDQKRLP